MSGYDLGAPLGTSEPVVAAPASATHVVPVVQLDEPQTKPLPAAPVDHTPVQSQPAPAAVPHVATHSVNVPQEPAPNPVVNAVAPPRYDAHAEELASAVDAKPVVPKEHHAADMHETQTLPTAPSVHPKAQARALNNASTEIVGREVEKTKAGERDLHDEPPKGTIIQGMEDDHLWALLRRFDLQVTHTLILTTTNTHPREPDLRRSTLPSIPFNSDVLKSNVERCYATVGIVGIRLYREIMRLRSWSPEDRQRTIYFCSAYFLAWVLGYAIPLVIVFLMVLVVVPDSRHFFFPIQPPPAGTPPSVTDPTNKKGDESLLGGVDHEVAHRSKYEQAEEQAWEFSQLAQGVFVRVAMGGKRKKDQGNSAVGEKVIDSSSSESSSDEEQALIKNGGGTTDADRPQGDTGATETVTHEDGTKETKPMSEKQRKKKEAIAAKAKRDAIVNQATKGVQDVLGDIADFFECMANALSPPAPYARNWAQLKIAGAILMPVMFATALVPAWIWMRGASFGFGFAFFGQPLIDRGIHLLVTKVPNWKDLLDIRNSILSGVPTNDQLVLHLLRVGERARVPLPRPPPPPLVNSPKMAMKDQGPNPDEGLVGSDGEPIDEDDLSTMDKTKHKTKSKIVGAFKGFTKKAAGFHGDVSVDGTKKKLGGKIDRMVWGLKIKDNDDPESYPAKLEDVSTGRIEIHPISAEYPTPMISFVTTGGREIFMRPINEIVEIKRSSVSIPRAALAFVSGADIESQTLMVRMKSPQEHARTRLDNAKGEQSAVEGDIFKFKTVYRREQLFVRLISMGNQRWESL